MFLLHGSLLKLDVHFEVLKIYVLTIFVYHILLNLLLLTKVDYLHWFHYETNSVLTKCVGTETIATCLEYTKD